MNYFCSLFKYANFSNNFSWCQKPYQKKQSPKKSLEGLLHVLCLSFLSIGMTWTEKTMLLTAGGK